TLEPASVSLPEPPASLRTDAMSASGVAVIVCTRGRPDIVASLVKQLRWQTQPPDHVFVIASEPDDIRELRETQPDLTVRVGRIGSTFQRNDGLALAGTRYGSIVFFDDDFVPSRFWLQRMSALFASRPEVAGMTGNILADGTRGAGIAL